LVVVGGGECGARPRAFLLEPLTEELLGTAWTNDPLSSTVTFHSSSARSVASAP
jgi:hypothetical protein